MSNQLLTVAQAAEMANISLGSVYRMAKDGRIPCIRIGKAIRFRPEALGIIVQEEAPIPKPGTKKVEEPMKEATFLDRLRPELEKAFRDIPAFGEIGFRVVIHDSQAVRIEYVSSISVKIDTSTRPEPTVTRTRYRVRN